MKSGRFLPAALTFAAVSGCAPTFKGPLNASSVEFTGGESLSANVSRGSVYMGSKTVVTRFGDDIWPGSHLSVTIAAPGQNGPLVQFDCTNLARADGKAAEDSQQQGRAGIRFTARSFTATAGVKGKQVDGTTDIRPGTQSISYRDAQGGTVALKARIPGGDIVCNFSPNP
jgi:hypothetical protein